MSYLVSDPLERQYLITGVRLEPAGLLTAANALSVAAVNEENLSDKEWQEGNKSKMHLASHCRALLQRMCKVNCTGAFLQADR